MELSLAISKNSIALGAFAIVTTAAIAATYLGTRDAIEAQERAAQAKALLEIVPADRHDNILLDDFLLIDDQEQLALEEARKMFIARQANEVVAFIIPSTAPEGYSGAIQLITGVNKDGTVAGVRVLSHSETPGLGDKVDIKKSGWILGFSGKSLTDPKPAGWKVKKDKGEFDQFTGATITPRAVTRAVYQTLLYYQANKKQILAQANPATTEEGQ